METHEVKASFLIKAEDRETVILLAQAAADDITAEHPDTKVVVFPDA